MIENARWISQQQARQEILIRYFQSMAYAKRDWVQKLFQWNEEDISSTLEKLLQRNYLYKRTFLEIAGEWYVLAKIDC
jgi:predicted HTH transcriptional regulator